MEDCFFKVSLACCQNSFVGSIRLFRWACRRIINISFDSLLGEPGVLVAHDLLWLDVLETSLIRVLRHSEMFFVRRGSFPLVFSVMVSCIFRFLLCC